jgi:hypothetical protein
MRKTEGLSNSTLKLAKSGHRSANISPEDLKIKSKTDFTLSSRKIMISNIAPSMKRKLLLIGTRRTKQQ